MARGMRSLAVAFPALLGLEESSGSLLVDPTLVDKQMRNHSPRRDGWGRGADVDDCFLSELGVPSSDALVHPSPGLPV